MLEQFIEDIQRVENNMDVTQMAEVLWLGSIITSKTVNVSTVKNNKSNEKIEFENRDSASELPRTVTHRVIISNAKEENAHKSKYGYEADEKSRGVYASSIRHTPKFPEIAKQFQALKIKEKRLSHKELNESKTADYIATTGLYHPIFSEVRERGGYLSLTMIVDTHESMFLWEDALNHFRKSLLHSNIFKKFSIYEFDSGKNEVLLRDATTGRKISVDSPLFKAEKRLTLVFTDVVGKLWRDKTMFGILDRWSNYSLTAIVSMLPKRMWQKTPLRLGISQYMKSTKFLPKNRDLKLEYAFMEQTLERNQSKIPIIPYDENAFAYLSQLMVAKKESWIDARIFTIDNKKNNPNTSKTSVVNTQLTAKERVERYFSSAIKEAKELAIYASVLPLHPKVLNELVILKSLGKDMDAFSEFYFGGLLDKSQSKKSEVYTFYKGVRKELLNYINMDEIKPVYEMLHRVISDALGIKKNILELLFEHGTKTDSLSKQEKELVALLIEILGTKGEFYRDELTELSKKTNTVYLKTNTYQMGSNNGRDNEKPVHQITFDYNFEIAKTPVTFEEYDLYCEDTKTEKPSDAGWGRGKRPVINVSWKNAQAYCQWLSKKTNKEYRLPTEAEWEYACRAGTTTKWSFGDDEKELDKYAWYTKNSDSKTHPVGEKLPNLWGLYDMHGNVQEWCSDDWVNDYNKIPRDGIAYKNKSSSGKVLRGGSWYDDAYYSRSTLRYWNFPDNLYNLVGFRLLRTLP